MYMVRSLVFYIKMSSTTEPYLRLIELDATSLDFRSQPETLIGLDLPDSRRLVHFACGGDGNH